MDNPFLRRATEQLRDDEAFLSIISPQPLVNFLKTPAQQGTLYDRLAHVQGTPGSGKTTIARLFEFSAISALLRNTGSTDYEALAGALEECRAIKDGLPAVLGCRLPMETDYRDFWEFPYPDSLKSGLLFTFIQARAILAWFRHLKAAGIGEDEVVIVPRQDAVAAVEAIGGIKGAAVAQKAREVERAVYEVVGALVAPSETEFAPSVTGTYRPFDVIERIQIDWRLGGNAKTLALIPLVILDDAHWLHPSQFEALEQWLARRELRIARWIISRFDILKPSEALAVIAEERNERANPGLSSTREIETVLLQSWSQRREQRTAFRRMARDMAERYLQRHPLLGPRKLTELGNLLSEEPESLSESKQAELEKQVASTQKRLKITDARRQELSEAAAAFRRGGAAAPTDVQLAMVSILLHRYSKRTKGQASLFGDDPEPSKPLVANTGVYEAAQLHLLHRYDRPFFFGTDDLCDASSENAELFLQLSATLVDTVATQIIRSKSPLLESGVQHRLLRDRARRIMELWSFPYVEQVRKLVGAIAAKCVETTMLPNGWLVPNAFGILQSEFDGLAARYPDLGRVVQFAVAYNALLVVPRHQTKDKEWCLLELAGPVCLSHGLSLMRGGFLEGTSTELNAMLGETAP